jgi:hypothetical protein
MRIPLAILGLLLAAAVNAAAPVLEESNVMIRVGKDKIDFLAGRDLVASYHIGPGVAKPYLWPINGPAGEPMTRAWPMVQARGPENSNDHVHQKSAWFCHGDVIPEGLPLKERAPGVAGVDFWAEGRGSGKIVCIKVGEPKHEKNHGWVTTLNEWRTADGIKLLDETRSVHLYDFGDTRLFVFDIDLQAGDYPITFGDTKEGSFGVRVNDDIREEFSRTKHGPGKLENAEGKVGEKNVWGYQSSWCDDSGPIQGHKVGIAVLADPTNQVPSCWHARGYGLLAANPFGRNKSGFPAEKGKTDLVKVAKGEHLKFRYGILVHPGDAKEGKVADYFDRFVKLKG